MVSDMEIARQLYEGLLDMPAAEVPLHYYYNYEQHWARPQLTRCTCLLSQYRQHQRVEHSDGLWYQLKKNTQLHVISGASLGKTNNAMFALTMTA